MIEVKNVTKKFNDTAALENISCTIESGNVFGMVGSNGAGKSTLLRIICGIICADSGEVVIDNEPAFENEKMKNEIVFVSDEPYFLAGASMNRMAKLYAAAYENFDMNYFNKLTQLFGLNPKKRISSFSKGMKRQVAIILALSARPKYLLLDETFDGLDPVMKGLVKKVICNEMVERDFCAVLTSHSLRELEDICDQIAFIHKGGLVYEKDTSDIKTSLIKVQVAFADGISMNAFDGLSMCSCTQNGSVYNIIFREDIATVEKAIKPLNPFLFDVLPLSLEEVFAHEVEALGYTFDLNILKGED